MERAILLEGKEITAPGKAFHRFIFEEAFTRVAKDLRYAWPMRIVSCDDGELASLLRFHALNTIGETPPTTAPLDDSWRS
jgi:hypothetical protein